MKVKIADIVEAFQMQNDEINYYVNAETGEVIFIQDDYMRMAEDKVDMDDLQDWEQEQVNDAIAVTEGLDSTFFALPTQRELNEYRIMVDFIDEVKNPAAAEDLAGAIKGKSAFRRFKEGVHRWDIEQDWYKFRDDAFAAAAIAWCDENELPYDEG